MVEFPKGGGAVASLMVTSVSAEDVVMSRAQGLPIQVCDVIMSDVVMSNVSLEPFLHDSRAKICLNFQVHLTPSVQEYV